MIDRRRLTRRQAQRYYAGDPIGCRVVLKHLGLRPTSADPRLVGTTQNIYRLRCVECGHEELREQHELGAMKRTQFCAHCPTEVRRKVKRTIRRRRRRHRPPPPAATYYRPAEAEALWHLWIHVHVLRARPRDSVPFEQRFDSERLFI